MPIEQFVIAAGAHDVLGRDLPELRRDAFQGLVGGESIGTAHARKKEQKAPPEE
ncbi:MAG: hypothetical protein ACJ79W_13610 [Myxococcales bacterium]